MYKSTEFQRSCSVLRKRGRPAGKNRVPLTLEERRARNAGYEKERREEIGDALKELRAAAGLGGNLTAQDLLAEVLYFLGSAMQSDSLEAERIRRRNDNLASQITMLEHRLATEPVPRVPQVQTPQSCEPYMKRKVEDCDWQSHPNKRFFPDHYWGGSESLHAGQHSSYHQVPWLPSEYQCHSPPARSRVQLHEPSACVQSSPGGPLSPAPSYTEALTPDAIVPTSPIPAVVSCLHSTHPDVKEEDLVGMVAVWADIVAVTDGPQLSLSQMNCWVTEEDLVSMYLSPIV